MTASTNKNYAEGQIESVRGSTHRLIWFCYEVAHFITTPLYLIFCVYKLFNMMGWTFMVGLSLMVICLYLDRRFHDNMHETNYKCHKLHEDRMNVTNEGFNSI